MSTKIYNGYISKLSLEQLLKKFILLVPKFEELKRDLYYKELSRQAVSVIDKRNSDECQCNPEYDRNGHKIMPETDTTGECLACKKNTINNNDQYKILRELHDKNEKKIDDVMLYLSRQDCDYSCSCSVFPMGKNKTLILFYCENRKMNDVWESLPFISDYHYQNSTDKPDRIPQKEWNKRRSDWDKVFGNDTPRERCYSFQFTIERLPYIKTKECLKHVPKKSKRTLDLIEDRYTGKEMQRLSETPEFKDKNRPYSLFEQARKNYLEYKKTDDFQKEVLSVFRSLVKIDFESKK